MRDFNAPYVLRPLEQHHFRRAATDPQLLRLGPNEAKNLNADLGLTEFTINGSGRNPKELRR
jgi:hypothetical protein